MKPLNIFHPERRHLAGICLAAIAILLSACTRDDDFVDPAFLHIEAIDLVPPASNPITLESGFYTSDIVACYVAAHYPGAPSLDTLGLFQLPFTVPILHDGPIEYLQVYPAVRQSGSSSQLPFYTFYNPITITKHTFTLGGTTYTDTLFTRSHDTLRFDTLHTTYNINLSNVHMFELFEPTSSSLFFDSVIWHKHAPDEACSGQGYASVHVPDTLDRVPFSIDYDFYVNDPTRAVYLELDSRSDIPFEIYMEDSYVSGSATDIQRVMVINPSSKWQHIYVNLGRTWRWFNHNIPFRLSFAALNVERQTGDIRIDNVRVLSTAITN